MNTEIKDIIAKIASIQMDAIKVIIDKPEEMDSGMICQYLQIDNIYISEEASKLYNFYRDVKEIPNLIRMANEYQLLVCSHILFKMETEWIITNPQGVWGAWKVIHESMAKFHPEFSILI